MPVAVGVAGVATSAAPYANDVHVSSTVAKNVTCWAPPMRLVQPSRLMQQARSVGAIPSCVRLEEVSRQGVGVKGAFHIEGAKSVRGKEAVDFGAAAGDGEAPLLAQSGA